jgi:hypothetical protein
MKITIEGAEKIPGLTVRFGEGGKVEIETTNNANALPLVERVREKLLLTAERVIDSSGMMTETLPHAAACFSAATSSR